MIVWGVVATLQAVSGSAHGIHVVRFFLGVFETAFISGAPYMTPSQSGMEALDMRLSECYNIREEPSLVG